MKFTLRSLFVLLFVCVSGAAFAIGRIEGTLTDQAGPVINAVVQVTQGGLPIGSALTDFDGNYVISPVAPGTYEVTFKYLQFVDIVNGVQVKTDGIVTVNRKMVTSQNALKGKGEVVVTASRFVVPLIDPKNGGGPNTIGAAQIEKAPTTNLIDLATTSAQSHQARNGGAASFGGNRSSNTMYIVDGVQLASGAASFVNPASGSVDQMSVYTSGIPARYGDATGGVITITTKGITPKLRGGIRLQHSVDGYNSNLGSFNLAGPLYSKYGKGADSGTKRPIVGFTLDGQAEYSKDNTPTYGKNYVVSDAKRAELEAHPLVRLPGASGVPATFYATESIRESDLTTQKARPDVDYYNGTLAAKLIFAINQQLSVTAGASGFARDGANFDQRNTLFSSEGASRRRAYTGRGFVRFTQKFKSAAPDSGKSSSISNAYYTLQADYQKDYATTQDKNHKHNTFNYGYVGKFEELLEPSYIPGNDDSTGAYGVRLVGYRRAGVRFTPSDINPILANYTKDYYALTPQQPSLLSDIAGGRGLRNGDLPNSNASTSQTYGIFNNIGAGTTGWSKTNNDQIAITLDASFDYKYKRTTHSLEFGLYYQQRNERSYNVNGNSLWTLMRLLENKAVDPSAVDQTDPYVIRNGQRYSLADIRAGKIVISPNDTILYQREAKPENSTTFDRNLRKKLGAKATDYINIDQYDPSTFSMDMFAPDDLWTNGSVRSSYYGYDWMGNRETGSVNFNDFFTKKDATGSFYTRPIGAYRPNYIAGYLSDYIQFKDFLITLGVRVERFDANTKVLKDPYSLAPVKTVADLTNGTIVPSNIGKDYVVYVGSNNSDNPTVIGYRNGDTWYDAGGNEVQNPVAIRTSTGSDKLEPWLQKTDGVVTDIKDAKFKPDQVFTDYKPQVNVMPRINFSFPLNLDALFYAHYDVLVQRPVGSAYNYATPLDYYFLRENPTGIIGNPDLKPEKTIDYQVGFQQRIGKNSSVKLEAFYKERKDQIQFRTYYQAYPTTYYTYGNRDFSTFKGFSLIYDLRRLGNSPISGTINYTLGFNEGTGSSPNSANAGNGSTGGGNGLQSSYIGAGLPGLRNQFPLETDSRHTINATVDYRYYDGKGPSINGNHFLQNAGASLIFRTRSGEPYTKYLNPQSFIQKDNIIEGGVNTSRLAWHYMFDLNIDKDFIIAIGKKDPTKSLVQDRRRHGGLSFNAFAYVQNLFNTKDVLGVYGYTGTPTDDGYLTSPAGITYASQRQDQQSFKELYNLRTQDVNLLNSPRTIVIGLKMNF